MTPRLDRRQFLKLSGSAVLAGALACSKTPERPIDIILTDDLLRGHRIYEGAPPTATDRVETRDLLVVGAGVAGLAAAWALRDRNPLVCELGARPGGSSASGEYHGVRYAQGAHYDLPYPANYGQETLSMLETLDLIRFNRKANRWDFVDTQYLINRDQESRTYGQNGFRDDPLPRGSDRAAFEQMIRTYRGNLIMPTRLITSDLHLLNKVSFSEFLGNMGLQGDAAFQQGLNYQMKDDYGAGAQAVSALAGLHYYACRPYYTEKLPHFSPPQGNAYFIDRFADALADDAVRCHSLVRKITDIDGGLDVEIIDLQANEIYRVQAKQVVYAGHKHALRYIYPQDAPLFAGNRYAPWLAVNLILDQQTKSNIWQNEGVGQDHGFVGMVNSRAQAAQTGPHVLTLYFCLGEGARKDLLEIAANPSPIVEQAVTVAENVLQQRLRHAVIAADVKLHGHAMPIPVPNYLFNDANPRRTNPNLAYAGCDNGYLPLFFEAVDSGLTAAAHLKA